MTTHTWHKATSGMGLWRHWLTDHGSLTQRLQSRCADFRVERLRQATDRLHPDEAEPVGLRPGKRAVIREVLLHCGATPMIFAHTVIPLRGLRGPWQALTGLGNRSLGSALFANPQVERFPLEFRRLDRRHPLYRAATGHAPTEENSLWGRRSLFSLEGHPILVTEVFLPGVLKLP